MSGSNLQRIEPLRKQTQFRAIDGLRSSDGALYVVVAFPLLPFLPRQEGKECCGGFATEAGLTTTWRGPRMRLSHLPSAGKVVWCYRGTGDTLLPMWG